MNNAMTKNNSILSWIQDWLILENKKQLKIWFRFSKTMCSFIKYNNLGYSIQDIYKNVFTKMTLKLEIISINFHVTPLSRNFLACLHFDTSSVLLFNDEGLFSMCNFSDAHKSQLPLPPL